jgi:hypothetical protein
MKCLLFSSRFYGSWEDATKFGANSPHHIPCKSAEQFWRCCFMLEPPKLTSAFQPEWNRPWAASQPCLQAQTVLTSSFRSREACKSAVSLSCCVSMATVRRHHGRFTPYTPAGYLNRRCVLAFPDLVPAFTQATSVINRRFSSCKNIEGKTNHVLLQPFRTTH